MAERARDHSDPVLLFEDFLALRAEDKNPDTRAFLVRAGERASELRDLFTTLQELEDIPNDPTDPSLLFEEYLVKRDSGEPVDFEEFVQRAGVHAEEFRGLIATLHGFEGLSVVLSEPRTVPSEFDALGRFQDLKQIGRGGLSVVFRGYDPKLRREVALKVIEPGGIGIEEVRGSVLAEARSLALLEHDSVVKVYDVDEAEGYDYIEMEYVAGPSLYETLEAMRALAKGEEVEDEGALAAARALESVPDRCRFVAQLARALHYCHDKGVIHRDVKPGNVLIEGTTPKIIDFGLAHSETQEDSFGLITQRLIATAPYAAPEQVELDRTGASAGSDQFSLGIVLYELLTLVNPFQKETQSATLNAVARAEPPAPRKLNQAIPLDVELICKHALERLPADRYSSIGGLADDLDAFLEYRAISVQPPSGFKQARLWLTRHKRQVIPALVSGVLVSGLGIAMWMRPEWAARKSSLARVDGWLERVPALETPEDFREALNAIIADSDTFGRQDESLFAGTLLPTVVPHLEELRGSVSKKLAEVVVTPFEAANEKISEEDRHAHFTQFRLAWQVPLALELAACPGANENNRFRDSGRLELPDGAKLFVWEGSSFPTHTPLDSEDVLPERGFYRVVVPLAAGGFSERDFHFSRVEPSRQLLPRPIASKLDARMVRIPSSEVELSYIDPRTIAIGSFKIDTDVVTWGEVQRVLPKAYELAKFMLSLTAGAPGATEVSFESDAPALLPYTDAQRFASEVGARIPTAPELWLAHEQGALPLPDSIAQEWVASVPFDDDRQRRAAFYYSELKASQRDATRWLESVQASAHAMTRGFRLAHSGD